MINKNVLVQSHERMYFLKAFSTLDDPNKVLQYIALQKCQFMWWKHFHDQSTPSIFKTLELKVFHKTLSLQFQKKMQLYDHRRLNNTDRW